MRRIIILLSSMAILVFSASAQNSYKLTIDELIEKGLANSIAIQESIIKTQVLDDKLALAKNRRLPDIVVGGAVGFVGKPAILDADLSFVKHSNTPAWKQNYQLSVTQPIYQGGRIKNSIEKSDLEKELASLSLQKDKSELKIWLIGKYLDLFNLYNTREVYSQNIVEAKVRLKDIQKMKEQGMITTNDVLRSQLQLTNFELAYNEVTNTIELISQQLTIAMGMDESMILETDNSVLQTAISIKHENDYVQEAYNQYPDMQIAKTNILLAQNNLKLTKADYLPTLSLQASNTLARPIPYASSATDMFINSWGVTLNLSYRISSLFDKKHSVGAAKRQVSMQELAKEQQMQTVRTSVKAAFIKHREAEDKIEVLTKSVEQANENYRITKNKYFNQLAILTDLLDANTLQMNAELQLTGAKTNAIYTYYQLQKISGNL